MNIHKLSQSSEVDLTVARYLADKIKANPALNLGLATGSTYIPLYQSLVRMIQEEAISLDQVHTFNLDCYADQDPGDESSFQSFMQRHFFGPLSMNPSQVHFPEFKDAIDYGKYDQIIEEAGGLDIVLLGIGVNAHIAFNEPGTPFQSKTHRIPLAKATLDANESFFRDGMVPKEAITMGISTILSARQIILVAKGESKANAIYDMVHAPIGKNVPATALRQHSNVDVYVDEKAALHL